MYLSIIIPVFNEARNLRRTVLSFCDYLKRQNYDYEIIIVNDGSTDETVKIAKKLQSEFAFIRVIDNKVNKGKGATVRQGLADGRGKYRLFIDADNATDISHIEDAWPLFEQGREIVIASRSFRDHPETRQEIRQAPWKRLLGFYGNQVIQRLTVRDIWDTQCGFKVFSIKALDIILPKLTINRWAFDVEMLVIAQKYNLKIGIIPVIWRNSDFSRVGVRGYLSSFKEVLKIKMNLIAGKY